MRGTVVCDLDGVVYLGGDAVPGAGAALTAIAEEGFRLVFATNAATLTPSSVAVRIESIVGYPADPKLVVTSAVAAVSLLGPDDEPVLPFGEDGLAQTLRDGGVALTSNPGEAGAVVAGLDRGLSYERLHRAAVAVRNGARLIATNTDATFPTPGGPAPGAGSIVAALETAAGVRAEVAGKPHPPMIAAVTRLLASGPTWMVGDRPETDLALARAAGWGRILVLSGVTDDLGAVAPELTPDAVVPSIAEVPEALHRLSA